jgi:outer membrane protein TolC
MAVNRAQHSVSRRSGIPALLAILSLAAAPALLSAQSSNPTSAVNPYFGSVSAHPVTDDVLKLSLDDAVRRGLENNLGLKEVEAGEKVYQGEKNQALQQFLPTITLTGDTGVYQHNLAALGFSPGILKDFASLFPGGKLPTGVSFITRDTLTEGQLHLSQTLFSGPVIAGWRAAGAAQRSAHFAKMSARGEVVQQVATAYLHAIAAASEVDNAKALEAEDQTLLDHAHDAHLAGTVANLDELRARVQLQSQQQARIAAENTLEKDLILLKREIGIDPGQKIALTDPAPYADLAAVSTATTASARSPASVPTATSSPRAHSSSRSSAKPVCAVIPKQPRPSGPMFSPNWPTSNPISISRCAPPSSTSTQATNSFRWRNPISS